MASLTKEDSMGKKIILLMTFLILGGCEVPEEVDAQGHFSKSEQQSQGVEQIPPAPPAIEEGVSVQLNPAPVEPEGDGETPDESIENKESTSVGVESEPEEEILLGKMPKVYMCVKGESVLAYLFYDNKSSFYDRVCELHYSYDSDSFTYAHWTPNHCKEKLTIKLREHIEEGGYTCYCGAAAIPAGIVSITDEGYVCSGENQ